MRSPLVAIFAVLGLLCAAVCGIAPLTRPGAQCPTAAVQTIAVRDCCDHVVHRAPRPGDKAFVQCACAEKRGATAKATVTTKVVLFLVEGEPLAARNLPQPAWIDHVYKARPSAWLSEPPLQPPSVS